MKHATLTSALFLLGLLAPRLGHSQESEMRIIATGKTFAAQGVDNATLIYYEPEVIEKFGWLPGTAHYPDGNKRDFEEIRYQPNGNTVEIRVSGNPFDLKPGVVSAISLRSENKLTLVLAVVELDVPVYMEMLSGGKKSLFVYRTKGRNQRELLDPGQKIVLEKSEIELPWENTYYVGDEKQIKEIRLTRKGVLKALGDHQDEMEAYIDENDPIFINAEDLSQIFDYYNTLSR